MTTLLVVSGLTLLAGILASWKFGLVGVAVAAVVTAVWGAVAYHGLGGFGSPTGYVPAFSLSKSVWPFFVSLIASLFFYAVFFFLQRYLTPGAFPKGLFLVWIVLLASAGLFHVGRSIYQEKTRLTYMVTVGYDEERPITWSDVQAVLKSQGEPEPVSFNLGGSSREANEYGFRLSLGSTLELYKQPTEIEVSFFESTPRVFKLDPQANHCILYFKKDGQVAFFETYVPF